MSANDYPYEEGGYTLYSYAKCPYAQRALRALYAANVQHKHVEIDLANRPSWYGQVNPHLKVPALRTPNGTVLIESLVISEYIADAFPDSGLLPTDALERAHMRLFIDVFSTHIVPNIYATLRAATREDQERCKRLLEEGIAMASRELVKQWQRCKTRGPLWLGSTVSLAEIDTISFVNQLAGPAHWRGFAVPQTQEFAAFNEWVDAFSRHPVYMKFSVPDKDVADVIRFYVPEAN
ncbi:hypothetical protein IW140_002806 [Coemansia sp. RSA 1813]|nr:hypothetical protein LPJ74_003348 [Coemansia sp. RSA 1843]KAJ2087548.1 hypothetical protein IW138_004918 [Coemansia sp. RSA 986]KAJ2211485.1 hypothetical protein EV179_005428 [Coemansia sp. RSA 487]KAJ2569918.1 hypothetical protein IW140_002806 [Coemansia sp. RSA 1813]